MPKTGALSRWRRSHEFWLLAVILALSLMLSLATDSFLTLQNLFVFEITGASGKIEQFVSLMLPLGLVEVARTGIAAIRRGPEGL